MRIIKLFFISAIVFGTLIFGLSLLFPSTAVVERAGTIEAPIDSVYAVINNLRTWERWNPWLSPDAAQQIQYSPDPAGKGAWYTWVNPQYPGSQGKTTIIESDAHKGVYYRLDYKDMKTTIGGLEIRGTDDHKGTAIRWYLKTELGLTPWWKLRGFMADRMMGPQIEQGLTRLKQTCEGTIADK